MMCTARPLKPNVDSEPIIYLNKPTVATEIRTVVIRGLISRLAPLVLSPQQAVASTGGRLSHRETKITPSEQPNLHETAYIFAKLQGQLKSVLEQINTLTSSI